MPHTIDDEVALLSTVAFFEQVDPGKLKILAYVSERLDFESGDIVFEQGARGDDVYFILDGVADVVMATGGKPVTVAQLARHALFGEISAFCDLPRTASVQAKGHLAVLRIPGEAFLGLIREEPEVALRIVRELALRLARTTRDLVAVQAGIGMRDGTGRPQ